MYKYLFFLPAVCFSIGLFAQTSVTGFSPGKQQALLLLNKTTFKKNNFWLKVNPELFEQNLRRNIEHPVFLYAGRNTNFCSYAALGYILIKDDPFAYVQFMISLYQNGKAVYGNTTFTPSKAVMQAAGQLLYEGELDINDADQVFFFTIADHFKGYLNLFNRNYNPGDEEKFWAATNLSKFNRMLRVMLKTDIRSVGSDIIRPTFKDLPSFLKERMVNGEVFLYLNNTILRKKNHNKLKRQIPTHYIVLQNITEEAGTATLTYWDVGLKTRQTISVKTLQKILYGVSWSTSKHKNDL